MRLLNCQTHAFFSEGGLLPLWQFLPGGPPSWGLVRARQCPDAGWQGQLCRQPCSCSPSPVPGANLLHKCSVLVVWELPGSLLCMCWFSVNTGQIWGLQVVLLGVCSYELLIVSLHCFCLFYAFLNSIKLNPVWWPVYRSKATECWQLHTVQPNVLHFTWSGLWLCLGGFPSLPRKPFLNCLQAGSSQVTSFRLDMCTSVPAMQTDVFKVVFSLP